MMGTGLGHYIFGCFDDRGVCSVKAAYLSAMAGHDNL